MLMSALSLNLRSARSLIWRTRSRVKFNELATSSAVISGWPMPKSIFNTVCSRSEMQLRAASKSEERDYISIN